MNFKTQFLLWLTFDQLGNEGVIVGVVGDKAQSIYDFLGATVQQFDKFYCCPGCRNMKYEGISVVRSR